MKISESFSVERSLEQVWETFQDIPEVVKCLPGATLLEDLGDHRYRGNVAVKLGPMQPTFEGEARVTPDPVAHEGRIVGKGVDKKGGSQGQMDVVYRLSSGGSGTQVDVEADFTLSGRAAQFGRVGLIQEMTKRLLSEFASNLEAKLDAATPEEASSVEATDLDATSLVAGSLWSLIRRFFARLFGG